VEPLLDENITVDVQRGEWEQLIRHSRGKSDYLDCFISHRKGAIKVVYAYSYDFQNPRREIITYSTPESDTIINYTKKTDEIPHAIPDDLWGNSEKAKNIVNAIITDIEKIFSSH